MAEDLSAVQSSVELRISDKSRDYPASGRLPLFAKLAITAIGCTALASCASGPNIFSQGQVVAPVVAAAAPPVGAAQVAVPPVRGKHGTEKPYVIAGKRYVPSSDSHYTAVGLASWYGGSFHGRLTADGERFDMMGLTAAHKTMPLPSYARVTNMTNGASIVVRVNDRGPYVGDRLIDLSSRAADLLQFKSSGVGKVKVEYVGRAPDEPSDARVLLATLRTDGTPAPLPSSGLPNTMVADATPSLPTPNSIAENDAADQPLPLSVAKPSIGMAKPASIRAIAEASKLASGQPDAPKPQVLALNNLAFTPLPPQRPRSSDGVLGKVPSLSSAPISLAKAKIAPTAPAVVASAPAPVVQPSMQDIAAGPAAIQQILMPTPAVAASMGQ